MAEVQETLELTGWDICPLALKGCEGALDRERFLESCSTKYGENCESKGTFDSEEGAHYFRGL